VKANPRSDNHRHVDLLSFCAFDVLAEERGGGEETPERIYAVSAGARPVPGMVCLALATSVAGLKPGSGLKRETAYAALKRRTTQSSRRVWLSWNCSKARTEFERLTARLKPRPDTKEAQERASSEAGEARIQLHKTPAFATLKRGASALSTFRLPRNGPSVVNTGARLAVVLVTALALAGASLAAPAGSPAERKQQARTQYENAERMREALNGRPESERTHKDYQKVADAYRRVYYVSPASSKADASVMAVAEILAEIGRQFAPDDKDLHAAIGQYEFLRREYPGSKYRTEALFTIGQIYKEDLGDEAGMIDLRH